MAEDPRPRKAPRKKAVPPPVPMVPVPTQPIPNPELIPGPPPEGVAVTEVYLDENDGLVAVLPKSPTEPGFRRGLFVMLVVLGVLTASSLIQARSNQEDLQDARRAQAVAEKQVRDLLREQREANEAAIQRSREATEDREALARRSQSLERLLVSVLANSDDPDLARAFEEFAREKGISTDVRVGSGQPDPPAASPPQAPDPAPTARSTPRPRPNPRPSPRPNPRPSPSEPNTTTVPAPVPLPLTPACVEVANRRVCVR